MALVVTETALRAVSMLVRYFQVVRALKKLQESTNPYKITPEDQRPTSRPFEKWTLGEEGDTKRAIWLWYTDTTPLLLINSSFETRKSQIVSPFPHG